MLVMLWVFSPALYVEGGEGLESCFTCEKLEATLRVPDSSHAEEPHQEVKTIHQECS